jgi:hypothetical protein
LATRTSLGLAAMRRTGGTEVGNPMVSIGASSDGWQYRQGARIAVRYPTYME